ncbi:helix-turn-helix domain-containing protein [Streptomyces sp. NBC_01795]|uniref:helix-turn-helix domain-containing protein n=1 Tax=Streptomyces sp. NBC_01795 TaxID=2975943 RepID=UPI003FA394F0
MPELNLLKEFDGQLSRIRTLIGRCFHKSYAVQGVAALRKRHGWTCQIPARRAIELGRERGGRLGEGDLAPGGRTVASLDAWLVFEDEAGFSMTPPTTRTVRPATHHHGQPRLCRPRRPGSPRSDTAYANSSTAPTSSTAAPPAPAFDAQPP